MSSVLSRLGLAVCGRQRPVSLSNNRGRHATVNITTLQSTRMLVFSRPADNLSCGGVRDITKVLDTLSGEKGTVLIVSRSGRLLVGVYSHIVHISREASS